MTRNDEFVDQLEGYLDEFEGMTPLPDAIRHAVRAQLPRTRQIGLLPGPMRYLSMTMRMPAAARYGLVAALLVVAAAFGASFLGRGIGGPPNPTPTPTPTPLPVATPGALPAAASLKAGTYLMHNPHLDDARLEGNPTAPTVAPPNSCPYGCADYRWITFSVPDGWATVDGLVFKHLDQANEVAFSAWTPAGIYADPCHWEGSALGPPLDNADPHTAITLQNQAGRNGSTPIATSIGGQWALRVELSVPADLDIASCDQGQYRSWPELGAPLHQANSHHSAGQIDVVYLVDVDRNTLAIDASHRPAASEEDLAELQAILDSMFIDRGD